MKTFLQKEDINRFKNEFLIAWFFANAIGFVLGWVLGEWLGIKVAGTLGWRFGQIVGVFVFEASIWVYRWAVLFRVRAYDVLKPIDTFIWMVTEFLVWIGIEPSNQSVSYREGSIFGLISAPIAAYFLGVSAWLILWLIRVQAQKARHPRPVPRSIISSFVRIVASLLVFILYFLSVFLGIHYGKVAAESFGVLIGRIVSGTLMGGCLSLFTGSALLRLFVLPAWDESAGG